MLRLKRQKDRGGACAVLSGLVLPGLLPAGGCPVLSISASNALIYLGAAQSWGSSRPWGGGVQGHAVVSEALELWPRLAARARGCFCASFWRRLAEFSADGRVFCLALHQRQVGWSSWVVGRAWWYFGD